MSWTRRGLVVVSLNGSGLADGCCAVAVTAGCEVERMIALCGSLPQCFCEII